MIPVKEISTQSVDMEFHSVAWGENKMVLDERTYEARANSRSPIAEFHAYWRASTEFRPVEDLPHINVQFLDMSDKNPANWSFRRHAGIFEGISNVANIPFDALRSVLLQDYMQTMRDGQPSYQLLQQDFSGLKREYAKLTIPFGQRLYYVSRVISQNSQENLANRTQPARRAGYLTNGAANLTSR